MQQQTTNNSMVHSMLNNNNRNNKQPIATQHIRTKKPDHEQKCGKKGQHKVTKKHRTPRKGTIQTNVKAKEYKPYPGGAGDPEGEGRVSQILRPGPHVRVFWTFIRTVSSCLCVCRPLYYVMLSDACSSLMFCFRTFSS